MANFKCTIYISCIYLFEWIMRAFVLNLGATEEGRLVQCIPLSFESHGWPSICVTFIWSSDGTTTHCERETQVDVSLTNTTYLNTAADQVPFIAMIFPDSSGLFQQDIAPCYSHCVTIERCMINRGQCFGNTIILYNYIHEASLRWNKMSWAHLFKEGVTEESWRRRPVRQTHKHIHSVTVTHLHNHHHPLLTGAETCLSR